MIIVQYNQPYGLRQNCYSDSNVGLLARLKWIKPFSRLTGVVATYETRYNLNIDPYAGQIRREENAMF